MVRWQNIVHRDNDKAKFSYMSLWGGPKALELFHNSALCNQKTSKNLLLVLKDYCNDNELDNELSCNKGTFDDEILYFLGRWQESWPFSDNNTKIL